MTAYKSPWFGTNLCRTNDTPPPRHEILLLIPAVREVITPASVEPAT